MPAISSTVRACALALAGLGLTASTMTTLPASAAPAAPIGASTAATATDTAGQQKSGQQKSGQQKSGKKKDRKKRERRAARRVDSRVLGAVGTAMRQRGDWYAYGAAGPNRFDCSGLIYYSYRRAGFPVPRTSGAQAGFTRRVAKKDLRPGDLMFFYNSGGVYHAAIFLRWTRGGAVMLNSPGSGQQVSINRPWTTQWFGGTLRR